MARYEKLSVLKWDEIATRSEWIKIIGIALRGKNHDCTPSDFDVFLRVIKHMDGVELIALRNYIRGIALSDSAKIISEMTKSKLMPDHRVAVRRDAAISKIRLWFYRENLK